MKKEWSETKNELVCTAIALVALVGAYTIWGGAGVAMMLAVSLAIIALAHLKTVIFATLILLGIQ
ncbi:hypothetical protein FACS1894185_4750 [Betaproteobacteria bacterium]|nr:hypothetical protein FACS1894185_4750 [Betaproteobacteria bacterium]